jgi:dipeptidase
MAAVMAALAVFPALAESCTTIIVGKDATVDGSIIIARNEDANGPSEPQDMAIIPARRAAARFESNSIFNPIDNRFSWPLVPNAIGYTAFPHSLSIGKHNFSFEETGINDYGVAISATETIFNGDKALKADPYLEKTGLTEDSITTVVFPYATSAREGVRILGAIIEKEGAGEGFGVAFSDRNEAWYLETASGHHWLAARIPDDSVFFSANQGRLQQADLSDSMNFVSSPGLMEFAVKNGLHDPAKGEFNFFQCCIADTEHDHFYNYPRVRELLKMFAGIRYEKEDGLYPVFVKPTAKIGVSDVAKALRNHYNGTEHDPYQLKNPKEPYRPISVMRTALSHITQTRQGLPDDIAVVQYIAAGMTDLSVYIPFYKGITKVPATYKGAKDKVDSVSLFWKYRKLEALTLQDYPRFAPLVHKEIAVFERRVAEMQSVMEANYLKIWQKDKNRAKRLIQQFTDAVVSEQERLIARLVATIAGKLGLKNMTDPQYQELIDTTEKLYHFHGA